MHSTASRVYPDAASAGAKILLNQCGLCHVAPLPDAHTAQEWPVVVARMKIHRVTRNLAPINSAYQTQLMNYLQAHADSGK